MLSSSVAVEVTTRLVYAINPRVRSRDMYKSCGVHFPNQTNLEVENTEGLNETCGGTCIEATAWHTQTVVRVTINGVELFPSQARGKCDAIILLVCPRQVAWALDRA